MKQLLQASLCLLGYSLLQPFSSNSQCTPNGSNLIPNPSFELTNAFCNGADNQVYYDQSPLQNWRGTDPLAVAGSTPDVKNNDGTTCGGATNAPNNTCFTGAKRVGFFVYTSFGGREYIQTTLTSPLTAGTTYCFSMTVRSNYSSIGNVLLNTDGIGAHFRNSAPINIQTMNGGNQFLGPGSTINATPQVQQPAGVVITSACTVVSGTFVATGGENLVVIGNFRNNASTTTSGSSSSGYMYVDDVRLYPVVPLPVELHSFGGDCDGTSNTISWNTLAETNSDYFTLERSCDGMSFTKIGTLDAAGNSATPKAYTFTDENPCYGITYYRLLQADIDGHVFSSEIISVACNSENGISVYPNPAKEWVNIHNSGTPITDVQIYSINGDLIETIHAPPSEKPGNEALQIPVSGIAKGVYLIRIGRQSEETVTYKLVIE